MSDLYTVRPIPVLKPSVLPTLGRASVPVNVHDSRAQEKLVDVRELGVRGDSFYARIEGSNPPYHQPIEGAIVQLYLRESVATQVAQVDSALKRLGLGLYVFDGYRPISTQRGIWNFFWNHFAKDDPSLTDAEVELKTQTFVSDPRKFDRDNPQTWPLHSTGGAVDLTLCDDSGELLDLGTPFDDSSAVAATAYFEEALANGKIATNDRRLLNRRILYWVMRDAGYTNYMYEWWHFDLGNQMYVFALDLLGEPLSSGAAWYGYTEPAN